LSLSGIIGCHVSAQIQNPNSQMFKTAKMRIMNRKFWSFVFGKLEIVSDLDIRISDFQRSYGAMRNQNEPQGCCRETQGHW
jgi:hypothetical protein